MGDDYGFQRMHNPAGRVAGSVPAPRDALITRLVEALEELARRAHIVSEIDDAWTPFEGCTRHDSCREVLALLTEARAATKA